MPADWQSLFGTHSGTATFLRKFHKPTNLEPHEQVRLVFEAINGQGTITLNGSPIGKASGTNDRLKIDVTTSLKQYNELTIELTFDPASSPSSPGGLTGPVSLEIHWDD
jgi:beta-galactosidase/beta-glucuronidase